MLLLTFLVKGLLTQARCVQGPWPLGWGLLLGTPTSRSGASRALHLWMSLKGRSSGAGYSPAPLSCLQRRRIKLLPHQAAREGLRQDRGAHPGLPRGHRGGLAGVRCHLHLRHRSHYRLKEKPRAGGDQTQTPPTPIQVKRRFPRCRGPFRPPCRAGSPAPGSCS